ncbi:MAG TPA: RusA family crossover junction endodeoxyribonuclease [Acidimicrobiales bacterium]|nr:RusA family crossover junction endodeoxyribonuclease [Acidimicrobiales bacterium]
MLAFTVPGVPVPQGSKRVVQGRVIDANAKRLKPWRATIADAASRERQGRTITGCVRVDVVFVLPRPRSHYRTGRYAGQLKPNAPVYCETRPDLDKLLRSLLDGLTDSGLIYDDDQVVELVARKHYGSPAAHIELRELG